MAKITVGTAYQVLTDGTNNGLLAAEAPVLLFIGTSAPTVNDSGILFSGERIQIGAPAKAWVKVAGQVPCNAVQFNY